MTLVSEKTLPLKNAIKDILLKIKNNETAMAMSGVGLGVAGVALSLPLFRYVGFDSLAGETAFLASTAMSGVSAITALMGVYKLSSIAINKLSQALDPIADRIDNSVKNFKDAPDAIDKLTAYREVFDKAINFLEENCKEANQADLVRALKTFNENIKVSGSKENMEKALENLQKEHLENINSFEYSVRNSKTGSILMSDAAFLLKRKGSQSCFNSDFPFFLV